jgi:hypothetical protein
MQSPNPVCNRSQDTFVSPRQGTLFSLAIFPHAMFSGTILVGVLEAIVLLSAWLISSMKTVYLGREQIQYEKLIRILTSSSS